MVVCTGLADIVDVADIAETLAISTSRVDTLTRYAGFPPPAVDRPRYRAWWREEVETWLRANRPDWSGTWPPGIPRGR